MTDRSKTRIFPVIELNKVRDLSTGEVYQVEDFIKPDPTILNMFNT